MNNYCYGPSVGQWIIYICAPRENIPKDIGEKFVFKSTIEILLVAFLLFRVLKESLA